MAAAHADLVRVHVRPVLHRPRRRARSQGKVALVSGGGSGHEPMHGGFVGMGMLDAACPGEVFTSPTPDQMIAATKAVDGGAGVVHIVKNYTGDVMNFEMAAELARGEGIEVEAVVIDDDVAVQDSLYTAGRRGVGATVLAGEDLRRGGRREAALAGGRRALPQGERERPQHGNGPDLVHRPGRRQADVRARRRRDGDRHRHPRRAGPRAEEAGARRRDRRELATPIVDDLPFEQGDEVLAFVNGMGGTPAIELYIVYNELDKLLEERGIKIARNLIGSYITSLEMAGTSITLLKLDDELTRLWDAPVTHAGPQVGHCSAVEAVRGDGSLRPGRRLDRGVRLDHGREQGVPDPARLRDRRRRPRHQHGSWDESRARQARGLGGGRRRRLAQDRRHDARVQRRRRRRPSVRNAVPADGHRDRGQERARAGGLGGRPRRGGRRRADARQGGARRQDDDRRLDPGTRRLPVRPSPTGRPSRTP